MVQEQQDQNSLLQEANKMNLHHADASIPRLRHGRDHATIIIRAQEGPPVDLLLDLHQQAIDSLLERPGQVSNAIGLLEDCLEMAYRWLDCGFPSYSRCGRTSDDEREETQPSSVEFHHAPPPPVIVPLSTFPATASNTSSVELYRHVLVPRGLTAIPDRETLYQVIALIGFNLGLLYHYQSMVPDSFGHNGSSANTGRSNMSTRICMAQAKSLYLFAIQVLAQLQGQEWQQMRLQREQDTQDYNYNPTRPSLGRFRDTTVLMLALWNNMANLSATVFDYAGFNACRVNVETILSGLVRSQENFAIDPAVEFFFKNWALNAYCSEMISGLAPAA